MADNTIASISQQRWITITVAFAAFMVVLDDYIVNISLPTIAHYFNVSTGSVVYVTLAYLLVLSSTLPIFGKLGDRFGFNRIFILGFCLFVIGSFFCGVSPSLALLIGSRCIQGFGGAILYGVGTAIIARYLPEHRKGWAFGILALSSGLGIALGAPLGGFITAWLSWHWVFLVNVPVGIIAAIVSIRVLPKDMTQGAGKEPGSRFDLPGALLSFFGLSLLVYAINRGQESGWTSPLILSLFAAAALLLAIFFVWEKRCPEPMLALSLFQLGAFRYAALAMFAAFALYAGNNFLMPFYLMLVKGLTPNVAGLVIMVYSVVYVIVSPFMGRLSDRIKPGTLCSSGMASATLACVFLIFALARPGILPAIIFMAWMAISYASFIAPNNNQVMSIVPQERQGIASAVYRTVQHLGMIIGVALFETLFSSVIPHAQAETSLTRAAIPTEVLLGGFRNAYILGAVIGGLALWLSVMARQKNQK
ncbi:MAG: MFS transporter [Chloroflexi bacterium]|nr:MFS transporter [Chloroflexota bacterium]